MKKMEIIIFMICFLAAGCALDNTIKKHDPTFTLEQLKGLFEKHGAPLIKQTEINPDAVFSRAYNDIKPEQFTLNKSQNISIYIYSSTKEAEKGLEDFSNSWAAADLAPYHSYHIANVLLFYGETNLEEDKIVKVVEELKSLMKE